MMKLLIIFISIVFLAGVTVLAVETNPDTAKSVKEVKIKKEPKREIKDSNTTDKPDNKSQTSPGNNQKPPKDYDSFIDKNNNGIDDRAEKKNTARKPSENPDK